jgi:hypothetical protein
MEDRAVLLFLILIASTILPMLFASHCLALLGSQGLGSACEGGCAGSNGCAGNLGEAVISGCRGCGDSSCDVRDYYGGSSVTTEQNLGNSRSHKESVLSKTEMASPGCGGAMCDCTNCPSGSGDCQGAPFVHCPCGGEGCHAAVGGCADLCVVHTKGTQCTSHGGAVSCSGHPWCSASLCSCRGMFCWNSQSKNLPCRGRCFCIPSVEECSCSCPIGGVLCKGSRECTCVEGLGGDCPCGFYCEIPGPPCHNNIQVCLCGGANCHNICPLPWCSSLGPGFPCAGPCLPPPQGVGGIAVSINKFGLLAPYIGLISTTTVGALASAVYVKRVKRRKEKQ